MNAYSIFVCYTLNSQLDNDNNSTIKKLTRNKFDHKMNKVLWLNATLNGDDRMFPWTEPAVYLHLHSPFIRVHPLLQGAFFKREGAFIFHYRMQEEHLLKFPYKTNCRNYISEWEKNNKTGPRSQESCTELCFKEIYCSASGGSVFFNTPYPISSCGDFAKEKLEKNKSDKSYQKESSSCLMQCNPNCVKYKYPYASQNYPTRLASNQENIKFIILLEEPEVRIVKHVPQYQDVELFSSVGGFLGLWLGISIYSFAEKIEYSFILFKSSFKRLQHLISVNIFRRRVPENEEKNDLQYVTVDDQQEDKSQDTESRENESQVLFTGTQV